MIVFAMPSVALASGMLISDRLVGTNSSTSRAWRRAAVAAPVLVLRPPRSLHHLHSGDGLRQRITETFCRRPVFAYPVVVLALISTGILAFGLWVHHMFATGLPRVGYSFYTSASMTVAIPTGLQIFCWLATMWDGRPRLPVPMLYVIGFIITFVIGGLTGVIVAAVPLDLQFHDTYFIVAHFHYVLIGGAVFPLLGILTYWYPKITGRMMSETLGKIGFWMVFLGFQLAFFPMHFSGLLGMPRRVYTYPAGLGLELPNLLATIGAFVVAPPSSCSSINGVVSLYRGAIAGPNPWDAPTLEWARSSPPPVVQFRPHPRRREPHAAMGHRRRAAGGERPSRRPEGNAADHRRRGDSPTSASRCPSRACGRSSRPARWASCSSHRSSRRGRSPSAWCRSASH